MCTMIATSTVVNGVGKGAEGWFPITRATVAYDHSTHGNADHALLLDFANYDRGVDARLAIELDLASSKALLNDLQAAIEAAETVSAPRPAAG